MNKELDKSRLELGIAIKLAIMGYKFYLEENEVSEEEQKEAIKKTLKDIIGSIN